MEQDLRQEDKEILKGLNHNLINTPAPAPAATPPPPVQATPELKSPAKVTKVEKAVKKENLVLTQLRQTFGLEKIKRAETMFNNMTFTLKALTAHWLSWADSAALLSVIDIDGNFNRLEYEAALKLYLAAAYVEKIDGLPIIEVFGEQDEKAARVKFADFLLNESSDLLGKKLFDAYDQDIEPYAKVTSGIIENPDMATYECTKCGHIMPYEKSEKTYFCHKDGVEMKEYKLEANLPLL